MASAEALGRARPARRDGATLPLDRPREFARLRPPGLRLLAAFRASASRVLEEAREAAGKGPAREPGRPGLAANEGRRSGPRQDARIARATIRRAVMPARLAAGLRRAKAAPALRAPDPLPLEPGGGWRPGNRCAHAPLPGPVRGGGPE